MKMMLIVQVLVGLNKGGAEMMMRRLVEAHQRNADDIRHVVVSMTDLGFHGDALRKQGVDVRCLGMRSPWQMMSAMVMLVRILNELKPDIVQTWMVHADLLGGVAARWAGVHRVIWGVRTTDYTVESRSTRFVRWMCAHLSPVIPACIVCAAQASLDNSREAGYDASKLMVIANGFDVQNLKRFAGQGRLIRAKVDRLRENGVVVVGCLGRYNSAKDHENFVKAAGILAACYPACRFLMVGRGLDASNEKLVSLISATGFDERFVLMGEQSDPASYLDAMDVFVLSSCTEGFPNALGEAMTLGIPCVSTDVGDAALLLGDAACIVPPRNANSLANAVARLLDMSSFERQALGRIGRERVERNFSIDIAANKFFTLYKMLILGPH